jgi:RNA polymerase sigma-70 factor (ECF subfamily)
MNGRAAANDQADSDADLVADLHRPGSDAFTALCHRYHRLIHRVAAAILRDEGEAEDVTQDVLLEIYRKSHLYEPSRGPVRVWLLQYAYSRSLRRRAILRRRAAYCGEQLDSVRLATGSSTHHLTRQECRWVLQTALAQLTERQRTTVELACLEDTSLQEVARRLRVSFGSARHYYYRGLARLRAWADEGAAAAPGGVGERPAVIRAPDRKRRRRRA